MGYLAAHDEARRAVGVTSLIQTPSVASPSHSHLLASPLSFCGALRSCGATVERQCCGATQIAVWEVASRGSALA